MALVEEDNTATLAAFPAAIPEESAPLSASAETPVVSDRKKDLAVITNPEHIHATVLQSLALQHASSKLQQRRQIPILKKEQVQIVSKLGKGSFSEVYAIKIPVESTAERVFQAIADATTRKDLPQTQKQQTLQQQRQRSSQRGWVSQSSHLSITSIHSQSSFMSSTATHKLALKQIRRDFLDDPCMTALGCKDAYYEVEILRSLPFHPHICGLVAVSTGFWQDPMQGFFLIERVAETLSQRLQRWRTRAASAVGSPPWYRFKRNYQRRLHDQRHRLHVAGLGLVAALEHLHDHGIVYRDLKPTNAGFDANGIVKLFDFGLSRTVIPSSPNALRRSGSAGTARYRAPETFAGQGEVLDFPSDVHSLGILLWEICTLRRPYGEFSSVEQLSDSTVHDEKRPSLRPVANKKVRNMLVQCWDPNPSCRPTSSETLCLLSTIIDDGTEKHSHKSVLRYGGTPTLQH